MARIFYDHVSKRFGNTVALQDLSLNIADGEFLALLGPSGCGKSTALRLLAGLEDVTEGNIYIGDRLVNRVPPKDRDIAMVFQSYALYPHMSVYENIAFGLKLRKVDRREIGQRVEEAADVLGIGNLLDRKPGQLSGGQRQRVALARAMVREPQAFLLDEPLSNLDAKLRVHTRAELSKLHQRLGTTFVYVTHDQIEAMTMATRIAVMNYGVLQQVDHPQELYERPRNVFVAGFIGSPAMNFFNVTVKGSPESMRLDAGPFEATVPPIRVKDLAPYLHKNILFGIRPENIHFAEFAPLGVGGTMLHARVEVTELMGNEVFLHLTSGEQEFLARVDPRTRARPGDEIRVILDMDHMHAFDAKTEETILHRHEKYLQA